MPALTMTPAKATTLPLLFVVPAVLALTGATLGCAGETADVRARFLSTRTACTGEVKVVQRDEKSSIPEDAPDREKLRLLLAAGKPGHDYYDVHGCGGGAVFDCFEEISYSDNGASRRVRHCGAMESWEPRVVASAGIEYEATDGSTREAPDDKITLVANKAAIASAVQDLPCDEASTQIVGTDADGHANAAEGCGVRVTYELIPYVPEGPPGRVATSGLRYKLKARASVGNGPQPPAAGSKP
jgi:hypothetical protein